MADALISLLIVKLATTAYEKIEKEVALVLEVKKQVGKVTSNLKAIQVVLEDAEKEQVTKDAVRDWLDKLNDVSFEMDDMLDEWNTRILIEIENQEHEGENALVSKKKVCFSILFGCFCFGPDNQVILYSNIAHKIEDLNKRLNDISKEQETFKFQRIERLEVPAQQHKITVSFLDKTFGRENESKEIVEKLLSESIADEKCPLVIPIVGMGGIGKTTLAQLAYNDESVKAHFDKRVWVCVSDPFDEIRVAKAIIGRDGIPDSNELEDVFQCLSKSIEGKKFLIVLDDVWTKWQDLKLPLQKGAKGSRILVTTRKEDVAICMGARESNMIHVNQLSETLCWLLFSHFAFCNWEQESNAFEPIGKKIVQKCKGLPLAAKTLGSLMNLKKTRKEWEDVLVSKIWELKVVEQDVFQPLLLSYYDLESATKRCLLYCAIFPKDHEIKKDELIEMWMSQDYLSLEGSQEKDSVGQSHFNDLARRSFFQDFEYANGILSVKMHDIVHDFVQFLTKKECFIAEVKDAKKRIEPLGGNVRHLTLRSALEDPSASTSLSSLISIDNCKKLRSLTTLGLKLPKLDPDFILQLKSIRTLKLVDSNINELPKEIGDLIHLRYVDLSRSYLKELPDDVCNLYNLETLCLNKCDKLLKLPKPIGKLKNLKYLHNYGCQKLEYLPKEIGRLTSLRKLDFLVFVGDDDETCTLADLKLLDNLQGNLILYRLGNVTDVSKAKKAQLWNKKHILSLTLDFGTGNYWRKGKNDGEILNALLPTQNLECLSIWDYRGTISSPEWMSSLQNLTQLHLWWWKNCEVLPPLGNLQSLEELDIRGWGKVKKVGVEFLGIQETHKLSKSSSAATILFPKLKKLTFSGMRGWEEWEIPGGLMEEDSRTKLMPCLLKLEIYRAKRLGALPDFLGKISTLQHLTILDCAILDSLCRGGGSEWPKISHIPNVKICCINFDCSGRRSFDST